MQSGYGVSEVPPFLVDGLCSPLFPSTTDQHPPPHYHHHHHHHQHTSSITTPTPSSFQLYHLQQQQQQQPQHHLQQQQQQQSHHQLQQFYHHHLQPPPPPPPPPPQHQQLEAVAAAARFVQFHPTPITQQFFEQQHQQQQTTTHQLHLFDQQRRGLHAHLGLDHDSPPPPTSASPAPPPFMSFRLAVSGGGSRDGLNDDNGTLLPTDDEACESRMNLWSTPPPPQPNEEDTTIKEPFWRPLDIDYPKSNGKRCKEKEATTVLEESSPKHFKEAKELVVPESEDTTNSATNYKLFSELEAICKPGGTPVATATGVANNTTGSSSALTGDNACVAAAPAAPNCTEFPADHASNASTGDEGSLKKSQSTLSSKARRRRRRRQQLSSISSFFESLVKQLMDHQESLHRRFLEILENRDHERERKEQQWREQEAAKSADDARARAEQQAAAAAREAAIVSFLEKITGQPLNLPTRAQFEIVETKNNASIEGSDENRATATMNSNRWPKVEVLALINVRSGLESRFQEPGLKGPLWEEVSSIMGTMGYRRSAKRCKEKWENINKYFRKTKESNKKRPHHSRTCPYFQQLDQLYSKSQNSDIPMDVDKRGSSELLDAIVVHTDHQTVARSDGPEGYDPNFGQENDRRDLEDEDDAHEDGEEEEEAAEEEGEGETQGVVQWNQPPNPDEEDDEEEEEEEEEEQTPLSSHKQQHPNLFFHALQSQ